MSTSVGKAYLDMRLNYNKFDKDLKGIGGKSKGKIMGTFGKLGKLAGFAFAAKMLVDFGKSSLKIASDIAEVQNVVDVTFGAMAEDVNAFADTAIKSFGLSELAAKKYASTMGAMLKSSGIGGTVAKDMSIEIAKLTSDMASFYNLEYDDMFSKILSGMSGMTMPLKQLGINLNVANLDAYALAQGMGKTYAQMSQSEQVLLRYNYLLKASSDSQGDFARTSGSLANQVKILKEQWKVFMGLIGNALTEIVLPLVKGLNFLLGILIDITKEIGKLYTLITGRKATVTASNNNISDTAGDATDNEEDLADGIDKAGKAANKALASFDELNILQKDMGSGSGGGIDDTGLGEIIPEGKSEINTNISTTAVDDGLSKDRFDGFFIWITNKWNALKQMFAIPLLVPSPVFANLPSPIYNPNWGLTPPMPVPAFRPIPSPVYNPNWGLTPPMSVPAFQPIPSPIYKPEWGLEVPQIPVPLFPAIEHGNYDVSLEAIKTIHAETARAMELESAGVSKRISEGLVTAANLNEKNYNTHGLNMGSIALGISAVLVANISQGLITTGANINSTITNTQSNMETWGKNLGSIAAQTAKSFAANIAEGLRVTAQNTVTFANGHLTNLVSWGNGVLSVAADTARGFVSNMVAGFRSTWDSFKSLMSGMGEKVSGFFRDHGKLILTIGAIGAVAVGGFVLAPLIPSAIGYGSAALGGLAAVGAISKRWNS